MKIRCSAKCRCGLLGEGSCVSLCQQDTCGNSLELAREMFTSVFNEPDFLALRNDFDTGNNHDSNPSNCT